MIGVCESLYREYNIGNAFAGNAVQLLPPKFVQREREIGVPLNAQFHSFCLGAYRCAITFGLTEF